MTDPTHSAPPTPAVSGAADLLQVEHLSMRFGGLLAIDDLSFTVKNNEISAIIGPNGAGKTTVFNCLTGFYRASIGQLLLTTKDKKFYLERMDGYKIARDARVARTFQNIRLFGNMSVLENLLVAQHNTLMHASGFTIKALFGLSSYKRTENEALEFSRYWLDKIGLTAYADINAANLAYGAQRRLEIARAMCTRPVMLCLDEPAAGLNPRESDELNQLLLAIKAEHRIAILLIEHDMNVVMQISDRVVVLDYGEKIADGSPAAISRDPAVIKAYLGEE